jgi:hypothetical protein
MVAQTVTASNPDVLYFNNEELANSCPLKKYVLKKYVLKKEEKTCVKSHLGEAGILPDGELVLAEAVAGDELPVLRVPHDGGDLATRVHTLQLVHAARVPHPVHTHGY